METHKVLGIEAARRTIFTEIQTTMESHGMNIDPRHIGILSDTMTYKASAFRVWRVQSLTCLAIIYRVKF